MDKSLSRGLSDQVQCETNPCVAAKLDVSIFCDDLLDIPCSSNLDTCSSSMFVELTLCYEASLPNSN